MDETGIDTYLYREYGYAPKGEKVQGNVSGKKYKRVGVVTAKRGSQVVAPLEYSGAMDSTLFEWWFTERLLPALPQGSVIVMDNAAFHHKQRLLSITEENGYRLVFLPPYSPELNSIENFWAWLKCFLRKILPSFPSFDDALYTAFQLW